MAGLLDQPVVCPVLIGRTPHVAALHQLFQCSTSGSGRTVLLRGEAGVGKTRLVAEVRLFAAEQGYRILQGACFQADSFSPYAPLLDLLRNHFEGRSAQAVAAALAQLAPVLYPLAPDLITLPPDRPSLPPLDASQEKQRLVAAFVQFFLRQMDDRPLLVIVEDLHWGDDNSLECLHHLARCCPTHRLVVLLTYRDDEVHPRLGHWLAQLDRERLAQEIALQGLTHSEVDAMLQAMFRQSRPIRTEFLDAIYALTEGNPFFIEEGITSLITAGDIFATDAGWDRKSMGRLRIPRSVQDAVQQRVERLSEPSLRVLRLAAVVGRRFDFTMLQALTGHDEQQLLALLKELIAAGLVIEESEDQFAFRHALTREVVHADLLARERRALHQTVAETIERQHVGALDVQLSDLAHHYYQAGQWEQALTYSRRAGERAMALHAPRAAIEQLTHAQHAAQNLGLTAPWAVVQLRGQAYEWVGDFEAASEDYETALELARAELDPRAEWQSMLDLGLLWTGRDHERSHEYYQHALNLARGLNQPASLAHTLNRLGNWYANADQPQQGLPLHQEALTIFQELGDRRGVAATLDLLGIVAFMTGDLGRMVDCFRQSAELAEQLDERRALVSNRATIVVGGGIVHGNMIAPAIDSASAVQSGEDALQLAAEVDWRAGAALTQALLSSHLGTLGEYGRALPLAKAALATSEEIDHRAWVTQAHLVLGALYLDLLALPLAQRQLEQALALARQLGSLYRLRTVSGFLAATYVADGDLPRAEAVLDAVLDPDTPMYTLGQRPCWWARAELALACGEPDQALLIADRMVASTANLDRGEQVAIPRLSLLRGEALSALRRYTEAEAALQMAGEGALRQGARPLLWRIHSAIGHLHLARNGYEDAEREFRAASTMIVELAATIPDDSVRDTFVRRASAGLPRQYRRTDHTAVPAAFGGLSRREREVAALIAAGKTNGEIAKELSVSKRTIETHVSNILSKLDFTSRAQVVAWAVANGLVGR